MEIVNSENYRAILETEIYKHASNHVELIIDEDLAQWASRRKGYLEGNPPAAGIVDSDSGAWGILLRRSIDEDWIDSIISRIEFGGFTKAKQVLNGPEIFLRHIVLHELAHLENDWGQNQEEQCDAWAFNKLGLKAI